MDVPALRRSGRDDGRRAAARATVSRSAQLHRREKQHHAADRAIQHAPRHGLAEPRRQQHRSRSPRNHTTLTVIAPIANASRAPSGSRAPAVPISRNVSRYTCGLSHVNASVISTIARPLCGGGATVSPRTSSVSWPGERAAQRIDAEPREIREAEVQHRVDEGRIAFDEHRCAADARADQDHVGQCAQQHDLADVRAHDALPQHECVLCADGDDERAAEYGAVRKASQFMVGDNSGSSRRMNRVALVCGQPENKRS